MNFLPFVSGIEKLAHPAVTQNMPKMRYGSHGRLIGANVSFIICGATIAPKILFKNNARLNKSYQCVRLSIKDQDCSFESPSGKFHQPKHILLQTLMQLPHIQKAIDIAYIH